MRRALAALALGAAAAGAAAHPHGEIACRARLLLEPGQPARLQGELVLDEAHSRETLALLRPDGQPEPDPQLLLRFTQGVHWQFARFGYFFGLEADGQAQRLRPGWPQVDLAQDRIRIRVELVGEGDWPAARAWSLACADPGYYWVARFAEPPELAGCGPQPVQAAVPEPGRADFGCADAWPHG